MIEFSVVVVKFFLTIIGIALVVTAYLGWKDKKKESIK